MLKGHVFKNQIFGNQIFALFINTFLNGRNGISNNYKNGMNVTYSGSTVTVDSGAVCIQGRFIEEDTSTDIYAGTDDSYCKLVVEVDLDKQNTASEFLQGTYKIVKSTSVYPTLTQTDIAKNNSGIYQYELARFRTSASGISEFQDMRTYLDFESIYSAIRTEYRNVLKQLEEELASVEDGSAYVLKSEANNVQVANAMITEDNDIEIYMQFKRVGKIVHVKTSFVIPIGMASGAGIVIINDFPDWAKTNEVVSAGNLVLSSNVSIVGAISNDICFLNSGIFKKGSDGSYRFSYAFGTRSDTTNSQTVSVFASYIVDDEEVTENDYMLGDTDGDGEVTVLDYRAELGYLRGYYGFTQKQLMAGDVNKDGIVDGVDVLQIAKYLNNEIDSFE